MHHESLFALFGWVYYIYSVGGGFIKLVGHYTPNTTCLQYANDTLLLVLADSCSLRNLRILLCCFQILSGLSINFTKSSLYLLGPAGDSMVEAASIVYCRIGYLPLTYLDFPLKPTALAPLEWEPLLDEIECRLLEGIHPI